MNRSTRTALVLAAISLAACTGSLFRSKAAPPTVYLLSAGMGSAASGAPAAGMPAAAIPADMTVLKPRVRPGLESDRIAVLYPDRHLDYFAGARWSGPLAEVLQDLAVQEFRTHANLRSVSGDASVFASAYWLEIEVMDFQAEYASAAAAPTVRVHFLARLGGSGDRRILGQFEANAQQPAVENRLSAIVDAYAHAADAALGDIVAHADETLAKVSEAR
ncbi:MAG TPA: ABC-type transport auxiliary lipoprotein family protein [Steroidobacteraceae bacterium]